MPGTTPVYGFPYPEPTDLVADYPALGQDLAEDIEAVLPTLGGMLPVAPTTIANSGGTATLSGYTVTFTTVNSVSLNGCFTTTYDNYRIVARGFSASGDIDVNMRLRASGTDATTSVYVREYLVSSLGSVSSGTATNDNWHFLYANTVSGYGALEVNRPFVATPTLFSSTGGRTTAHIVVTGYHNVSTAYDGFTLYPTSSTLTGTVSVYGYKK